MDQTESTLLCKCWPSLRESVNTLQAAVSAYDRADTDYVNRARSRARSRAADAIATATATATARTTTTTTDAEESQARHELETARKLVEVACERYSSSIHRLFDECNARIYELTTATTTTTTTTAATAAAATCTATVPVPVTPGTTTATAHSSNSNDIHNRTMEELESLLDEQRNFVFRDMERHYEAAIAQHKIRWDRARGAIERPSTTTTSTSISTSGGGGAAAAAAVAAANVRATLQTALDSSEKVVDAIESTKMNISVDWWTFREAMNQWIQTTRDNHSLSPRNRVYIGLFDTRAHAHTQNSKLDDNGIGINGGGGGGSSSKSIDHNGMGGGDFEPDGFCVPSIDSISLYWDEMR